MARPTQDPASVFLNVPYDKGYQPLFVSLVSALVHLGHHPHCVLEIPETGQGRLRRVADLLHSCGVSIHDLSRQAQPARFNMPFELGLAWSLALQGAGHKVILMDSAPHRLDKVLSDLKGHDPLIHGNTCDRLIGSLLDVVARPVPPIDELRAEARVLRRLAREIARSYKTETVFQTALFLALIETAVQRAEDRGYLKP